MSILGTKSTIATEKSKTYSSFYSMSITYVFMKDKNTIILISIFKQTELVLSHLVLEDLYHSHTTPQIKKGQKMKLQSPILGQTLMEDSVTLAIHAHQTRPNNMEERVTSAMQ